MKHVLLHLDDGIVLGVLHLRGEMVSRAARQPPVFDDPRSYKLRLSAAELSMDMASLTHLMNDYVFAYDGAPLKNLTVEADEGMLKQKGKVHKGVWLPFSMKATVGPSADGRLRLHTESMRALGIPATRLLDLLGLQLDELIEIEKRRGVEVVDDDIIVTPGSALPPPEIQGHLSVAEIVDGRLRLVFSPVDGRPAAALTPPDRRANHYVYFAQSVIRFGKLTMTGADLQLIDADDRDEFDFYPAKYNAQLVAGYSKNTPERGLMTYMPDFNDLTPGTSLRPSRR